MDYRKENSDHYHHGNLLGAIYAGPEKQGIRPVDASVSTKSSALTVSLE